VDCPKRLQRTCSERVLLLLQKYSLEVKYKKGRELYIADTMIVSRAYLKESGDERNQVDVLKMKIIKELEDISVIQELPNDQQRFEAIRRATAADGAMKKLQDM